MKPIGHRVFLTKDGSTSISIAGFAVDDQSPDKSCLSVASEETYHSRSGAVSETRAVFIENGLAYALKQKGLLLSKGEEAFAILEVGWGTGLNSLFTLSFLVGLAKQNPTLNLTMHYTALEPYPLAPDLVAQLNYLTFVNPQLRAFFKASHESPAGTTLRFKEGGLNFSFCRWRCRLEQFKGERRFELVYFDAFAPQKTKAIWQLENFKRLHSQMTDEAVLVSYSAAASFRRHLLGAGFKVERLPGALGKREMLRALREST